MALMRGQIKEFKELIQRNLDYLPIILLHGSNTFHIKEKCDEIVDLVCGPTGKIEMRVQKTTETNLLKSPDDLKILIKTSSFFPGKQVVIIEEATDKIEKILSTELQGWTNLDATIVVISKSLKANSKLRKLIDPNPKLLSFAFYDLTDNSNEVGKIIKNSGIKIEDTKVLKFLCEQDNFSTSEAFRNLIDTLTLFKYNDPEPLSFEDLELFVAQASDPSEIEMCNALAIGNYNRMLFILQNLFSKGTKANQIINAANRHFKLLYHISMDPSKIEETLNTSFPPLFGARRAQIIRQSHIWTRNKLERANLLIFEADKDLRLSTKASMQTVTERCFLRISSLITNVQ